MTLGPHHSLLWVVLYTVGCLAAFLASTDQMPIASPPSPQLSYQKCLQILPDVPWWGGRSKSSLVENHQLRIMHLRAHVLWHTRFTIARQASLSMGFPSQEYWSGLPFTPPGDLFDPGIEPMSPAALALAGGFSTTELPGKPFYLKNHNYWYHTHCPCKIGPCRRNSKEWMDTDPNYGWTRPLWEEEWDCMETEVSFPLKALLPLNRHLNCGSQLVSVLMGRCWPRYPLLLNFPGLGHSEESTGKRAGRVTVRGAAPTHRQVEQICPSLGISHIKQGLWHQ